jgi:hypothetical protein
MSYAAISVILNVEGILTPAGRPSWHKIHVERLLHTMHVRDLAEKLGAG